MILYFDSYITDEPLIKEYVAPNNQLRSYCKNYAMPKKLDIAKYTLTSYATYPWSNVLIKYQLEDGQDYQSFDTFIKQLWPKAVILHHRSDNQQKFRESMEILDTFEDEWIFYAANNDHPLIAPDLSMLSETIAKAQELKKKRKLVSAFYSHFSEFVNLTRPGNPFYSTYAKDVRIIDEDKNTVSIVRGNGDTTGLQIVHKNLFRQWFCSVDLGNARIIRPENVWQKVYVLNQVIVIPKREICAHFDGYSHTMGLSREIQPDQVPPLFIPPGFFEKNIRIAYGYSDYREGWTNINPAATKFSFRDNKTGTDLKIMLQDIPLFWKDRIKEIDINKNADAKELQKGRDRYFAVLKNPYAFYHKPFTLATMRFYASPNALKYQLMRFKIGRKLAGLKRRTGEKLIRLKKTIKDSFGGVKNNISKEKIQVLATGGMASVKLHIGCGPHILKGWINMDLSYEPYEDYLKYYTDEYYPKEIRGDRSDFYPIDITKEKFPLPDNSVDVIFHEDFIEHIDQRSQVSFLAESFRVLKKGGIQRINTPNLLSSMRDNSDFSKGFDGVYFQEWDEHHHKSLLTPNSLKELALMIGYSEVIFNGRNKSISNIIPKEYRPAPWNRPEDGNLFADLIK